VTSIDALDVWISDLWKHEQARARAVA